MARDPLGDTRVDVPRGLAAGRGSRNSLAGAARHQPRAGERRRGRARPRRDGGLGRPAARPAGAGRPVGRQRLLAGSDRHVPRAGAPAPAGAGSRQRTGRDGTWARPRARDLGRWRLVGPAVGRGGLLRGRGRTVHQRQRRLDGLVLRRGHDAARRSAPRRAAPGRRLELRGRAWRDGVVLRDDDQRARRAARARAGDRRLGRGGGGPSSRRGVHARARDVPAEVDRRGDRPRLAPVLVPDLVALRRAPRARLPARCGNRT